MKAAKSILEIEGTIKIPSTIVNFNAKNYFNINTKDNQFVKIRLIGDRFILWFLANGKTEDPIIQQKLCYYKLQKYSDDRHIITVLGGEAKVEITLSEISFLMDMQKNGQPGVLLNNYWSNIFYVRDNVGMLRSVFVRWEDKGWFINANYIDDSSEWPDGFRVFSRI